jgi:hypothetical protein
MPGKTAPYLGYDQRTLYIARMLLAVTISLWKSVMYDREQGKKYDTA